MMKNDFLLPNELGWECNDELQDYFERWAKKSTKFIDKVPTKVMTAELIDNFYAIIKKYQ